MTRNIDAEDASVVQRAFIGTGLPTDRSVLDHTSVLHIPGRSGVAGAYQGGETILGLAQRMADATDGTLQFRASRVLGGNHEAFVLIGHTAAYRRGIRLDTEAVHVLWIGPAGIREIWVFHDRQDTVDDFWTA